MDEFNSELCTERHRFIVKAFEETGARLKKVENRFLAIMTTLALNLIGIIGVLLAVLYKGG